MHDRYTEEPLSRRVPVRFYSNTLFKMHSRIKRSSKTNVTLYREAFLSTIHPLLILLRFSAVRSSLQAFILINFIYPHCLPRSGFASFHQKSIQIIPHLQPLQLFRRPGALFNLSLQVSNPFGYGSLQFEVSSPCARSTTQTLAHKLGAFFQTGQAFPFFGHLESAISLNWL